MSEPIRLTQYSHGAGCGCKISPKVLEVILAGSGAQNLDPNLWVGNASRDDAAVYAIDGERGVVSTTDFFMPIVDDPFDFGRIAATNAISDIYAMGGDPLMAIAILGWPVNVLAPEIAREVIAGGRKVCDEAGIPLAGGHSIDAPEPIFGLAVTGLVDWQVFYYRSDAWTNPLSSDTTQQATTTPPPQMPVQTTVAGTRTAVIPDGVRIVLNLASGQAISGELMRDWVRPTIGGGKSS